jgi:hypothetical protein
VLKFAFYEPALMLDATVYIGDATTLGGYRKRRRDAAVYPPVPSAAPDVKYSCHADESETGQP